VLNASGKLNKDSGNRMSARTGLARAIASHLPDLPASASTHTARQAARWHPVWPQARHSGFHFVGTPGEHRTDTLSGT